MAEGWKFGMALALAGAVGACGSGGGGGADETPATPDAGEQNPGGAEAAGGGEGEGEAALTELVVDVPNETLQAGATATVGLIGRYADGTEKDVAALATWETSDPAVLTVEAGTVTAVAVGSAQITATFESFSMSQDFEVIEPVIEGLTISPQVMELKRDEPEQLTVTATYGNGETRDVTAEVTWETSNADVATVDANGLVTPLRGGPVELTATLGEQRVSLSATTTCEYPRYARALRYGAIFPPLFWEDAYRPDGSKFDFRMEDVYCDVAYKDVKVFFLMVSAGWCAPCTLYQQRLMPEAAFIQDAGGLIAILEAENEDFGPADNDYAQRHLERIIGDRYAIRIGDRDTQPITDFVKQQPFLQAFPTMVAVRTRDMAVITDSNRSNYYLPLLQIAQDPEADWSNPGLPPFSNHCGPNDDEPSEATNDDPGTAAALEPGSHHGGICDEGPDFYQVTVEGDWTLEMDFDGELADLDVYAWDPALQQPLQIGADVVGSAGTTSHEEFSHRGPTVIAVIGYQGSSGAYDLKLTPR